MDALIQDEDAIEVGGVAPNLYNFCTDHTLLRRTSPTVKSYICLVNVIGFNKLFVL